MIAAGIGLIPGGKAGGITEHRATTVRLCEGSAFAPLLPELRLTREYIWGPGDGPAGVDELLVQFDLDRNPWWVLQDAGGDIVAPN